MLTETRFLLRQLLFVLFFSLTTALSAQTVNIFVHQWPSTAWGFPDPAVVNTAYSNHFTTVNITTGLIPGTGNLGTYDVLVVCELTFSGTTSIFSNAQRGVVEAFINNGGHVVWVSENSISGNAPGSNQSMVAIQNVWGIGINRVPTFANPCVPYHPGNGPGGLCTGVVSTNTTSSYDYFSGPATLHQNCVLAGSGGTTSCDQGLIQGMCFLFENPYICDFNGTVTLYGEVQMWSTLMANGQHAQHYSNVAALHHALITGNVTAIDAINTAFSPNPNCTAPSPCTVFAVDLSGFGVERMGERDAELVWWTESEAANKGFEVEQALPTNGDPDFKQIGFVEGAGQSLEQIMYKFPALNLVPGTHQFRLRIVDEHGGAEYSEVRSFFVEGREEPEVFPTVWESGMSAFQIYWPVTESVVVELVDMQGRVLQQLHNGSLEAGNTSMAISPDALGAGAYIIRATGTHSKTVERILVY